MSEDEVKAEFKAKLWWLKFPRMWEEVGTAMRIHCVIKEKQEELAALRSKHIRKGRPVGWRKPSSSV